MYSYTHCEFLVDKEPSHVHPHRLKEVAAPQHPLLPLLRSEHPRLRSHRLENLGGASADAKCRDYIFEHTELQSDC